MTDQGHWISLKQNYSLIFKRKQKTKESCGALVDRKINMTIYSMYLWSLTGRWTTSWFSLHSKTNRPKYNIGHNKASFVVTNLVTAVNIFCSYTLL
jgi:hypothetical protein